MNKQDESFLAKIQGKKIAQLKEQALKHGIKGIDYKYEKLGEIIDNVEQFVEIDKYMGEIIQTFEGQEKFQVKPDLNKHLKWDCVTCGTKTDPTKLAFFCAQEGINRRVCPPCCMQFAINLHFEDCKIHEHKPLWGLVGFANNPEHAAKMVKPTCSCCLANLQIDKMSKICDNVDELKDYHTNCLDSVQARLVYAALKDILDKKKEIEKTAVEKKVEKTEKTATAAKNKTDKTEKTEKTATAAKNKTDKTEKTATAAEKETDNYATSEYVASRDYLDIRDEQERQRRDWLKKKTLETNKDVNITSLADFPSLCIQSQPSERKVSEWLNKNKF